MLKSKKFWFGLIISVVCLYYSFKGIKIKEVIAALRIVNYWYLLPALFFSLFTLFTRTYRWKLLIKDHKNLKFYDIWVTNCIGFMALFTLPARLGDLLRAYLLGQRTGVKKTMVLSTIVLERILDGIGAILIFLIALNFFPIDNMNRYSFDKKIFGYNCSINLKQIIIIVSLLYLVALGILILIKIFSKQSLKFACFFIKFAPHKYQEKLKTIISSFIDGLESIGTFFNFIKMIIYSVLLWTLNSVPAFFVVKGFHIPFNFFHVIILNGFLIFALMIPAAPGFIGTYHIAVLLVLKLYNIEGANALSFAWILWLVGCVVDVSAGGYYLYKENLSILKIEKEYSNE